jgi:beta-lactamase regulating signal transducer with metallopeptidase domain
LRLDTANRSFAGLAVVSAFAGMLALCAGVGCVLLALLISRLASDGAEVVATQPDAVWPAIAFIVVVGAGAVLGLASVRRQLRASRALATRVNDSELPRPRELEEAVMKAGLTGRVKLVDSGQRFSFAYGVLAPRVALSRGLVEVAEPAEIDAVLVHERYHVHNLDPLKVLLSRALPKSFYYVPLLGALHARYLAGRELAADRRAAAACGRQPLAGALYKVLRGPDWPELSAAAAIGGPELLDVRVAQLEGGSEPPVPGIGIRALSLSLMGAAFLTTLFVVAVLGFGGPSAIADATGGSLTALDLAGAVLCAIPWVLGGWLGLRWLSARARRPLDISGD